MALPALLALSCRACALPPNMHPFDGLLQPRHPLTVRACDAQPTEQYRFEEPTSIRRRDMRKGSQTCLARAGCDKIEVTAEWDEPCAGAHRYTSSSAKCRPLVGLSAEHEVCATMQSAHSVCLCGLCSSHQLMAVMCALQAA